MRRLYAGAACFLSLVGAGASGVALGEVSFREGPAHDAAARGGILFCCTAQGTGLLARGRQRIRLPKGVLQWSPDRRLFIWVLSDGRGNDRLGVTDVRGNKRVLLKARRFRRMTGRFVFGAIGWTPDSKRIVYTREIPAGEEDPELQLFTIRVAGGGETRIPLPADTQFAGSPSVSPTDDVIALPTREERPGVFEFSTWLVDLDGSTQPRRLISSSTDSVYPMGWSPNGRKLAMEIPEPRGLHVVDVATGTAKLVARWPSPGGGVSDVSWAPDSRRLAFTTYYGRARYYGNDIRVINADGTGLYDPTRTPKTHSDERAVWSPNGRRLAFVRSLTESAIKGRRTAERLQRIYRANPTRTLVVPAKGGQARRLPPLRDNETISGWR
jgi:Tol biopolymer transport system component